MGDISVFYNNRIVDIRPHSSTIADKSVNFGDFCLTPVRCLFKGHKVKLSTKNYKAILTVGSRIDEAYSGISGRFFAGYPPSFFRVIASIVFLIPGLILGSIFKGLGYLSKDIRERHAIAILHYTPIDRTIGDDNNRLDLKEIIQKLNDERINNHLNQPTKSLIVYAKQNTELDVDPGFHALNPQKIILDGAKIGNQPCSLDDQLGNSKKWDKGHISGLPIVNNAFPLPSNNRVLQWKVKSVNDAIQDILPRKSIFSTERLRRVYVV